MYTLPEVVVEQVLANLAACGYTVIAPCGTDITPIIKEHYEVG